MLYYYYCLNSPTNTAYWCVQAIQAELQRAIRKRDQSREQEKAMYKRMMTGTGTKSSQKLPGSGTATPPTSSSSWVSYRKHRC